MLNLHWFFVFNTQIFWWTGKRNINKSLKKLLKNETKNPKIFTQIFQQQFACIYHLPVYLMVRG